MGYRQVALSRVAPAHRLDGRRDVAGIGLLAVAEMGAIRMLAMAAIGARRDGPAWPLVIAYFLALGLMLVLHIHFGWRSFTGIGDLDSPQTRYYNILWPGAALGGAIAIGMLARRSRWLAMLAVALYLVPTTAGGILAALI